MATPSERPSRDPLHADLLAIRDALGRALDPATGDVPPRKLALLRNALRTCTALTARLGLTAGDGVPDPRTAGDSRELILAGRHAAHIGHHPVSMLILRPASKETPAPLDALLEIAQAQLRATGDLARLLEGERVIAITLESDRPGGLAALRRITRVAADRGIELGRFEYSLTELDHAAPGEGIVRRVGEGFRPLTLEPELARPRRVLALDDDPAVLAVIVEQLEGCGLGFEVESTTSGYEACIRFGDFEPDLVVLDIRMPEIDGRDALSTMKRSAGGRDVKFLVASAMPEYFDDMRRRGCDACLQKPFDLEELTETVRTLLDVPPLAAPSAA